MSIDNDDQIHSAATAAFPFLIVGAATAIGTTLGLGFGLLIGIATAPSPQAAADVVTADDVTFAKVCAPIQEEADTQIEKLSVDIDDLTHRIADRKKQAAHLEAEMDKRAGAGKKLWNQLQQVREELAVSMQQKEALEYEKADLILSLTRTETQLADTEEALDEQVELTEEYRFESIEYNFERFVNASQLTICEKGNRKKLGQCRETVQEKLMVGPTRDKFAHCVRSGQAMPTVLVMEKGETMPQFAEYIDEEERITRDWYILLCDPTLPEADDGFFNEEHLPETNGGDFDDLDDFE
jgi:hypothetical protein